MNIGTISVKNAAARLLAALCLMAVVYGCGGEIEPVVGPTGGTLTLAAGDAPDFSGEPVLTKGKVYTEDGSFVFQDGDQIAIWYSDNTYRTFPVQGGIVETGSQTATREKWAIYPASAAPAASSAYSGENPYVIYATEYTVSGSEVDSQMPLIAKNTEGNNKLLFYHVGGLLRLKLYGVPSGVRKVKIEFEQSYITGTYAVNVGTPTTPVTTTGTDRGKVVTFLFPDSVQSTAYVNIPLPAGDYPSQTLTITLYDENGQIVKDSNSTADSFTATADKLGTVDRRDGRMLGVSLLGFLDAVEKVELDASAGFLETRTGLQYPIGGLFLNDNPFEAQLYATVFYRTGSRIADNTMVTWTSSDPTKVRVDRGLVMAVDVTGDNPVLITAAAVDDPTKTASVYISVTKDSPTGNFRQVPFSISDTETVEFSPGNLIADISGSTVSWRFASHQYEFLGAHSGNYKASDATDIFYFSGVGNNFGLMGASADESNLGIFRDWGLNQIAYRGDANYAPAGTYGTLDGPELQYLLYTRTGDKAGRIGERADCRFAGVNVEGVYGIMIFPDNFQWVRSTMGDYPKRINTYAAPDNSAYSGAQWAALEDAGVVFLPATGSRSGDIITSAGTSARYLTGGKDIDTTRTEVRFLDYAYGFNNGYWSPVEIDRTTYTKPDTTRTYLAFSTTSFDGFSTTGSFNTTGSVRLVKRPPIPNTVWPLLPPRVVKVVINNGEPYQMVLGTPGELRALVYWSDGTQEWKDIVKLLELDRYDAKAAFKNHHDVISISGRVVTPRKFGYCLVYAEWEGVRASPILVAVADKNPNGNNYYIHTANGTRVEFAPGNLRARLNSTATAAEYWYFAPNQYDFLAPHVIGEYSTRMTGGTDTEHFAYSDTGNPYGLILGKNGTDSNGFTDWGGLSIRRSQNNASNPYQVDYWKTPSHEEWSDFYNGFRQMRRTSDGFRMSMSLDIYEINGNMCTILIPDGLLVELPDYTGDPISLTRWQELQALGCVAIPHSGSNHWGRNHTGDGDPEKNTMRYYHRQHGVNGEGFYWSSTYIIDGSTYPCTNVWPYSYDPLTESATRRHTASSWNTYNGYDMVYYTWLSYHHVGGTQSVTSSAGNSYNFDSDPPRMYDSNYNGAIFNFANSSTFRTSHFAVRLIRLLDKPSGY